MKDQNYYYPNNNNQYPTQHAQNYYYGGLNTYQKEEWKSANYQNDIEMGNSESLSTETQIRLGFIRKVFGILSAQMLATTLLCIISVSSSSFALFQKTHPELMIVALIISIVTIIALTCFKSVSRTVPTNYIVLAVFTFAEAYLVSAICGMTAPKLVVMAATMTCAITCALTIYACTTKTDFTVMNSMLFIFSMVMLLFGIFLMFTKIKILHIIYSCLGVLLYSFYLIYDIQLIMGDKENALDIDDYVYASAMLYLDIINLFLHVLNLLKQSSE